MNPASSSGREWLRAIARRAMTERGFEPDFPPDVVREANALHEPQGLPGGAVTRLSWKGEKVVGEERLLTDRTPRLRIRDVRQGPDGALYLLTDDPLAGKLLRLVPKAGRTSGGN